MTGGRGFVGRYLAPRLEALYPDHRRVMIVASGDRPSAESQWEAIEQDLTDEAGVRRLFANLNPEIVVHLAAQASGAQAHKAAELTWRVNVGGAIGLALAVAGQPTPARLVFFTSTGDVYGSSCLAGPAGETTPAAPGNSYALSKLAAERILQDLLPPQTRLIITRAFNHSGPGQDERFVMPSFAAQIARAERGEGPTTIRVGNLAAERDFLHVEDVVDAYEQALRAADSLPTRTLLNVASGAPRRLADMLDLLRAKATRPIEVAVDPERMRPSDVPHMVGDATRLRELTGWAPRLGVEQMLDDLLAAARARPADGSRSQGAAALNRPD
jgi:GDP-4-dehydro-6-deoxy-D-mannose reductase